MSDFKILMEEMSKLTEPECAKSCRMPYSCCAPEYCGMAMDFAKQTFGISLGRTNHPHLPLMGSSGCTAEPYLRPLCTLHTCDVNSLGFKPNDPEWTEKYFDLRKKVNAAWPKGRV